MDIDLQPLWLTFKLASITTVCLLVIGLPLAALLAQSRSRFKSVIEALVSLPLVLPPSVLGFYLLLALSPAHGFGGWLQSWFNIRLIFTFPGLVIGSVIYSLPFMVHPIQGGLEALPESLQHASWTLGRSNFDTFFKVLLPNIRPALLTGIVLTFAHTLGEFGLVLMIGGSLPGVTKVASIAIYNEAEALNFHAAHVYSAVLLVVSFSILLLVYIINKQLVKNRLAL
ncbi:molybdate ABC transporter permease subunit [Mucilaginibacter polytrichastri]|uniref:Molybdenum transport system permease n=1 Tax=Mucilaginibacter polytrichastri TaxID=1302689 RepID=A0A1Q5ZUI7_9SPHI|nr:molybdate ABC transporter permease subunit [Mucilaginibacter polytrichastri]OKS85348.1 Molybdenum transport system permease protein modB [Mucilaginibacter polytrichastri]SFS40343.1 molybdate transport system permease protein [Mucilaginibacter polytrichastri]